jgi:outer membrane protein OmpA-like peptidoglycan-associated protein
MNTKVAKYLALVLAALLVLAAPLYGQEQGETQQDQRPGSEQAQEPEYQQDADRQDQPGTEQAYGETQTRIVGQSRDVTGVIIKRDADTLTIRDRQGNDTEVVLSDDTEVKERKRNPFRRAREYGVTQLIPGLAVVAEGRADEAGRLVAEEVKFRDDDYKIVSAIEARVDPVEGRVTTTEQASERLSGQLEELQAISNAARGGATAAQETADEALGTAQSAQQVAERANRSVENLDQRVDARISALDDFDVATETMVHFRVGSANLSDEAKAKLDEIVAQFQNERGYMLEIAGFASSDGNENFNRQLSQRRADAVVRYLAEEHNVSLRRMITPFGYGENQPVADNSTREGREQNRRVEVRMLVNRGLTEAAGATGTPADTRTEDQRNDLGQQGQRPAADTTEREDSEVDRQQDADVNDHQDSPEYE